MLPETAKAALKLLAQHLEAIDASIAAVDKKIAAVHAQNPVSRLLAGIPGVGKIAASAIAASAPDPRIFKPGFSASLGATPRQNSGGGKEKLGAISQKANRPAARAGRSNRFKRSRRGDLVGSRVVGKCKGALHAIGWSVFSRASPREEYRGVAASSGAAHDLLARKPARGVSVALANKLARIIWAIMTAGAAFRMETFERG